MSDAEAEGMVDEEVGVEEAPSATNEAPAGKEPMSVAGVTINETQLPLFIVLIASIVLLIATGAHYDWKVTENGSYAGYAISISSISLSLSFLALLMNKISDDLYSKFGLHMNKLCFAYTFIGACFLTFDKPFRGTGNGYFAAWATVYGSAMAMGMTANALGSSVKGLGAVMGSLASSLVLLLATIPPIRDDVDKSEAVYALALACVTIVFLLLVLAYEKKTGSVHALAYFGALAILSMCWIIMACLVTFRGPFVETGNGYFASWTGAGTVTMAAFAALQAWRE
mmetsp:Transcript_20613/g.35410  ORF Transcript_20613/g.35410 Transcript_20613/m.35410 type:complete len:284 (+) Transcript_20613:146-997(+)|eukprot:CAMPEP_0183703448 /NCGR_PEP_ID=MMETSP0737-20130205/1193_1 /TAXON_ID=385413 /ORGANISM="Thalassiosira miniscula, Strain CCMP1093" /LENGTH=283 /DNA_ID=CAMNT_0025930205 /DNA_START=285 /DNA_END=1136 /DNA_ORIENTATION=-